MKNIHCLLFLLAGIFVANTSFSYVLEPTFASGDIVQQIIEYQNSNTWYTGKGLVPGDSFTYYICDPQLYAPYLIGELGEYHHANNLYDGCYMLQLDFHTKLLSQGQEIWIVQGIIQADHTSKKGDANSQNFLFLINAHTFEIDTITSTGAALANSIRNTVFYLVSFANELEPQQLVVGDVWGNVHSFLNDDIKLIVTSKGYTIIENDVDFYNNDNHGIRSQSLGVHLLQYRVLEPSTFAISLDLPFPVDSTVFDPLQFTLDVPEPLFTLDLRSYSRGPTSIVVHPAGFSGVDGGMPDGNAPLVSQMFITPTNISSYEKPHNRSSYTIPGNTTVIDTANFYDNGSILVDELVTVVSTIEKHP